MKKINEEILKEEFLADTEEDLMDLIDEFLSEDNRRIMKEIVVREDDESGIEATLYYNLYV